MRSKLITVVTAVASTLLVGQVAAADPVQEQFRLMEQRMAEMEDRLQATSDELNTAKATVQEQQALLTDAGLTEEEAGDFRSGVGDFLKEVDINGVAAASFNYRFMGGSDGNLSNPTFASHPNADTFQVDQIWISLDKPATEESRAGFHADFVTGTAATSYAAGADSDKTPQLFSGYVSYLGSHGIQVDAGLLPTPFGAESVRADQRYNITQGAVWGLEPVVNTGVTFTVPLGDELSLLLGVVNDVASDTFIDDSRDKAYEAQLRYANEFGGLNIGAIVGKNSNGGLQNGAGADCDGGDECKTSIFNVTATANPGERTSLWADFVWVRNFGSDTLSDGDAFGVGVAGRQGLTEDNGTGIAFRLEYLRGDAAFNRSVGNLGQNELVTATLTGDHSLTDNLTFRAEVRYDHNLSNGALFAHDNDASASATNPSLSDREGTLAALAQILYGF